MFLCISEVSPQCSKALGASDDTTTSNKTKITIKRLVADLFTGPLAAEVISFLRYKDTSQLSLLLFLIDAASTPATLTQERKVG